MALARVAAQHITATGTSTAPAATLPSAPTQGNLLVAVISEKTGGVVSISLSGWTLVPTDGNVTVAGQVQHSVFYKIAGASESATVTGSLSGNANWRIVVVEYNDSAAGTWTLDKSAHGSGGTTAADSGTTASTTQSAEVWVAAFSEDGSRTLGTLTNSFTAFESSSAAPGVYLLDKVVAATGTANSGGTWSGNTNWVGTVATFYSAAAAAASLPPDLDRRVRRNSLLSRCSGILVPRLWLPEPGEALPAI